MPTMNVMPCFSGRHAVSLWDRDMARHGVMTRPCHAHTCFRNIGRISWMDIDLGFEMVSFELCCEWIDC